MIFDSHCHVQFNAYKNDADVVIKRTIEKGVKMLVVGSQNSTSQRAVEYAEKYPGHIWAAVGLHPVHLIEQEVEEDEEHIKFKSREERFDFGFYKKLASHPKVVAIGEVGLEYYHQPKNIPFEELKKIQSENFIQHCRLADEFNLPVIIHCREAHADQTELVKKIIAGGGLKKRGVVHCFTGDWSAAEKYLQMGFYIGFTGIITFSAKKSNPQPTLDLLEVVQKIPLDRFLVETDSPYLAPQSYRGERAEPWMVEEVVKKIAEIRQISITEVTEKALNNTQKLFSFNFSTI